MDAPSADTIKRLKDQHQDRQLHLVELKDADDDEVYFFIMSGPNDDEYKKFVDDTFDARDKAKNDVDKNERLRFVAKNAIMRQAVWPEREDVKALLFRRPGFVLALADKIHDHAGSSAEVRSKKL